MSIKPSVITDPLSLIGTSLHAKAFPRHKGWIVGSVTTVGEHQVVTLISAHNGESHLEPWERIVNLLHRGEITRGSSNASHIVRR